MIFMKKSIIALFVAALMLTATPALAKGNNHGENGRHLGKVFTKIEDRMQKLGNKLDKLVPSDQFVLTGTVGSTTSGSVVVTVKNGVHLPTLTNNIATVNVDSNTKITGEKNQTVTLADIKAGQQLVVQGTVSGSLLTAKNVHLLFPVGKAFGEVTAKTDTSITIKNNVTGTTQTFTTNGDTKVTINGDSKALADLNVGDRGIVKFKSNLLGTVARIVNLFR